jgi:hypothetical protein
MATLDCIFVAERLERIGRLRRSRRRARIGNHDGCREKYVRDGDRRTIARVQRDRDERINSWE